MSSALEAAEVIRAGDEFKQERHKTFEFAKFTDRPILPLEPMSKSTLCGEHLDSNWHPDKLGSWNNNLQVSHILARPELNVGVLFGDHVLDIDIDSTDPALSAALDHYLARYPTPYKWGRSSKPRSHVAYVLSEPFDRALFSRSIKALATDKNIRIEIRGGESKSNFFSMMPGSIHETGELVRWDKSYDPNVTPAPLGDVRPLMQGIRRAVAAALIAPYIQKGNRHFLFMSLTGILVRMWKQAEDSETTENAMNEAEAWDFIQLIQKLSGDEDDRKGDFQSSWRKFMNDPTTPISGGTKFAELIGGSEGIYLRNLVYKLIVDDDQFEQAEGALERFIMMRVPNAGILDLETLKPHISITGAMKNDDLSMLFTSYRVPFGQNTVPLPAFLKTSSQVTKAVGMELRPDLPPRSIFPVIRTEEEHGYDDESLFVNSWTGFQFHPSKAEVSEEDVRPFLDYVFNVVANQDNKRFEWILSWFADIFQDPADKPGTLLALTGPQGSGKTMLGEIAGSIIGIAHYGKVGSIEDITKEFNSRVHYKLLVQADETASTQRTAISRDLKELVTGSHQAIVYKGKESFQSFNPARYFFTSNNSGDALRVEAGYERRYTIFETSHKMVGKLDYWKEFVDWWSLSKNLRAIHKYLKNYKYKKSFIRIAMGTEEKRLHQMNAMPPIVQWMLQRISEGYPISVDTHTDSYMAYKATMVQMGAQTRVSPAPNHVDRLQWPNLVELQALTNDFFEWLRRHNVRTAQPQTAVSKLLSDMRGGGRAQYNSITAKKNGVNVRPKLMRFPERDQCIAGLISVYPSLEAEIRAACDVPEEFEVDGEDLSGEI